MLDWVRNVLPKTIPKSPRKSTRKPSIKKKHGSVPKSSSLPRSPTKRITRSATSSKPRIDPHKPRHRSSSWTMPPAFKIDPKIVNYRCSAAFALFWNLALTILPDEVIESFDRFLHDLCPPRMDAAGAIAQDENGYGTYTVALPNHEFTFHSAELAPPSGICTENYARYCSFPQ